MQESNNPVVVGLLIVLALANLVPCAQSEVHSSGLDHRPNAIRIPPNDLEADSDYLFKTIEEVHPNPYAFSSKREITRQRESAVRVLKHPMTRLEFYRLFAPIVAELNDEHTLLSPPGDEIGKYLSNGGLLFPIKPILRNGKIYIGTNYSSNSALAAGSLIVAINGVKSRDLLTRLSEFAVGSRVEHRLALVEKHFDILLWIVYGFEGPFTLDIREAGHDRNETVYGVSSSLIQKMDKARANQESSMPHSFTILNGGKTGLLVMNSFGELNEEAAFLNSTFAEIKQSSVRSLVIDLRENDGGFMGASDLLLSYIIRKPVSQLVRAESKVSVPVQNYLRAQSDLSTLPSYYRSAAEKQLQAAAGTVLSFAGNQVQPNPLAFRGKVYVLIGRSTYSSASLFAATVRAQHLGVLVGEPTGGLGTQFADPCPFKLPHTGLQGIISHSYLIADPRQEHQSTIPDVLVPVKVSDILSGKDAALSYVLTR